MHYFNFVILLLPAATFAAQHTVEVGDDGKFIYNPDTVQAAVGDTVVFEFYPGGHSVAQSTFDNPCQPAANGIWSGFFNPSSGTDSNVFEITINDMNPIWIYCAQIGHCNSGMAMVINPPSTGSNTLAAYKSAAANAKAATPQNVGGGVVTAASAVITSTSTSESSASSGSTSATATSSTPANATTSAPSTVSSSPAAFTGASSRNGIVGALMAVVGAGVFGLFM